MPRRFHQSVRSGEASADTFFERAVEIFQSLWGARAYHGVNSGFMII
jgi:hypothetical protein